MEVTTTKAIDQRNIIKIPVTDITEPAEAATATILKTVADKDNCIELPVQVEEITKKLGLRIKPEDLKWKLEGYLERPEEDDSVNIVINSNKPVLRKRFTMAHEIGHYIRQYQDETGAFNGPHRDERSAKGFDPDEIWANNFAASLLMPASIVRKYWAQGKTVSEMARIFGVSETAMDIRRANLGLEG